jgi:hypothetical protein
MPPRIRIAVLKGDTRTTVGTRVPQPSRYLMQVEIE